VAFSVPFCFSQTFIGFACLRLLSSAKILSPLRVGLKAEVQISPGEISPGAYFDNTRALQLSILMTAW
jgi:hypothetical protein